MSLLDFFCDSSSLHCFLSVDELWNEEGHVGKEVEDDGGVADAYCLVYESRTIIGAFAFCLVELAAVIGDSHRI